VNVPCSQLARLPRRVGMVDVSRRPFVREASPGNCAAIIAIWHWDKTFEEVGDHRCDIHAGSQPITTSMPAVYAGTASGAATPPETGSVSGVIAWDGPLGSPSRSGVAWRVGVAWGDNVGEPSLRSLRNDASSWGTGRRRGCRRGDGDCRHRRHGQGRKYYPRQASTPSAAKCFTNMCVMTHLRSPSISDFNPNSQCRYSPRAAARVTFRYFREKPVRFPMTLLQSNESKSSGIAPM
jgi:hypothetical protein